MRGMIPSKRPVDPSVLLIRSQLACASSCSRPPEEMLRKTDQLAPPWVDVSLFNNADSAVTIQSEFAKN
jgi:hypothetical protein